MYFHKNVYVQVISDTSDGVYENTTPKPSSSSSLETPSSVSNKPIPPQKPTSSPAPSPPPKRPVARQRSNPTKTSNEPAYQNFPPASELPLSPSPVPSPKPRTRGLRSSPVPPAKSPKPTRATSTDNSSPGKVLPPLPPSKPQKSPVPPFKTSTPIKPAKQEVRALSSHSDNNGYSPVGLSADIGPSIEVVDEDSGRRVPLVKVEDQLTNSGRMDVSQSSSIMDTVSLACNVTRHCMTCMYSVRIMNVYNFTVF